MNKNDKSYCLIYAVRDGKLERVKELIDSPYPKAMVNNYSLLCTAIREGHTEVAKLLLTSGFSPPNRKYMRKDPKSIALHCAVKMGDIEILQLILDHGGDIDNKDWENRTPLDIAVEKLNVKVTELLLDNGANACAVDNEGRTQLHLAVSRGCLQIVQCLLKYPACINTQCRKGYTPLHYAAEESNEEFIMLLLSSGARIDVKGEDGINPLHLAAQKGYVRNVEHLLNNGACIKSLTIEKEYTPLHFASAVDNDKVVKLLLDRGADINATTKDNKTPLHIAAENGCRTVMKLLLQQGAKVDSQDKNGHTILYHAVKRIKFAIPQDVFEIIHGIIDDQNERNALEYFTIIQDILMYCPDINSRSNRKALKIAVLCCKQWGSEIPQALLEYGLNIDPDDANNTDLLHAAVEKGHLKIVEDLLKYGANVNTLHYLKGCTPLHSAVKNKQEEVAKLLINYEADINAQDKYGETPIIYAIKHVDIKMIMLLLTNKASIRDSPDVLTIATRTLCVDIVEVLLQHGANINASDKNGKTALHFTSLRQLPFCERKNSDSRGKIAKILLYKGANVDTQDENGLTALHDAIERGYSEVVQALLEYNANINYEADGFTPLHRSAKNGNAEISRMLLNKGANVNAIQKFGITALHFATQKGHKEVVKVLLEHGAKVDYKSIAGDRPLCMDYKEIILILSKFGADFYSKDVDGLTPLHVASHKGYYDVVSTLLEHGADINMAYKNHFTPLHYAILERNKHNMRVTPDRDTLPHELTIKALIRHIVCMKTQNVYVSEDNLSMSHNYEAEIFRDKCENEIANMKSEKINSYISFFDILAKTPHIIAIYMRNENIVQLLKSIDYETKFPIYGGAIGYRVRKGIERKDLLVQVNQIFHFMFKNVPELPYECNEQILSYLGEQDLKMLMDTCKHL